MRQVALRWCFLGVFVLAGCGVDGEPPGTVDAQLRAQIRTHGIRALDAAPAQTPEQVALGQVLFFDKVLSGNRDISCATCHHPLFALGDGLSVSIGTGGRGLGPERVLDKGSFIPRNAPEIFNRGDALWTTMFWDGRISGSPLEGLRTPAGSQLPQGLPNILAAQAMFPVTSRDEMRGHAGDRDVFGQPNELAEVADGDFLQMWQLLMVRLRAIPEYEALFAAAYPQTTPAQWGFQHAAAAIAAFEVELGNLVDTPWDRYLRGDSDALSPAAKRGALLFLGEAGCVRCHSGPLLTDQQFHVLAVPQVGPGKGAEAPADFGRGRETLQPQDRFAFRTPPLRNVAVTGPWMHDGAYTSLELAVRHHLDALNAWQRYDASQLDPRLRPTLRSDAQEVRQMFANLDPHLRVPLRLSDAAIGDLLTFLEALTDPAVFALERFIPSRVPSGLPVQD